MFSSRLPRELCPTPFFEALSREKENAPYVDLTYSSPAESGLPNPFGEMFRNVEKKQNTNKYSNTAQAVSAYYAKRGISVCPEQIRFTSGTSEAYSVLFKIFCNPGDVVLTPTPGYPLLETLAGLEYLKCYPYFLKQENNRWKIDLNSLMSAPLSTKILLLVSPHNPTGHTVSHQEWHEILLFCKERKIILIVDEVFGDYADYFNTQRSMLYPRNDVPVFWLNGLSKTVGTPLAKLSWIVYHIEDTFKKSLEGALDYVLDAYLSVSEMSQKIAEKLLVNSLDYQKSVQDRLQCNRKILFQYFSPENISAESGWYASLYFSDTEDDVLTLQLLRELRILVLPGFFFDFQEDGWIVVSLLTEPELFEKSIRKINLRMKS